MDTSNEVTDPSILSRLNAPANAPAEGKEVTDPTILARLNASNYAHPDTVRHAPESDFPYIADQVNKTTAGMVGALGVPVSMVNQLLEQTGLPVSNRPVGGYDMMSEGAEKAFGVKNLKAPTDSMGHISKLTEYKAEMASFLAGAALPEMWAFKELGAASRGTKMAHAGMTALSAAGGATTAVEGKEWGKDFAAAHGMNPQQGEIIGGMIGSVIGPGLLVGVTAAVKGLKAEAEKAAATRGWGTSPAAQKAHANKLILEETEHALANSPNSEAEGARAVQLMQKIKNFRPTHPQQTNSPGLKALAQEVANKSAVNYAQAHAVQERNIAAVKAYTEKTFGPAHQDLTGPAKTELLLQQQGLDLHIEKLTDDIRDLDAKFNRAGNDTEAIGEELRTKYWEAKSAAQGVNRKKTSEIYSLADRMGIRVGMGDTREVVQKIVGADKETFQNMPPVFAKVLKEYPTATADKYVRETVSKPGAVKPMYTTKVEKGNPGKDEGSFQELHSLYKQTNREWADATSAGDSQKAMYLALLRDHLKQKVDTFNGAEFGELGKKFSQFNRDYGRYSRIFKEGTGAMISKRRPNGIAVDAEDIVTKTILRSGDKKKGVQDFFNIYGSDPRAAELLHDGLLDSYSKAAMKDGQFTPAAAQRWLDQHHQALSELPDTAKKFQDAQKMGDAMLNRRTELVKQREALDRSEVAKVAGSEQPEKLIASAVNDPKVMRALMAGAHTRESKQAIARSVADYVGKQKDGVRFLRENEVVLKPVMEQLGKGHWDNLVSIEEANAILKRVEPPHAVELSKPKDPLEAKTGTTVKSAISRFKNMNTPLGLSPEVMITEAAGKFMFKVQSAEMERLRMAAYWDADVASTLARVEKVRATGGKLSKEEIAHFVNTAWLYGVRVDREVKRTQEHQRDERAEEARMKEHY
jgi:hypothetical protein